jgi:hypothetical protein
VRVEVISSAVTEAKPSRDLGHWLDSEFTEDVNEYKVVERVDPVPD